ncbi:hypothetical protein Dimus_036955 [Dionaea muscipula]
MRLSRRREPAYTVTGDQPTISSLMASRSVSAFLIQGSNSIGNGAIPEGQMPVDWEYDSDPDELTEL